MAAVRALIATSVHEGLELFQWDVQGAFCTSDVDTEIYMQAPTGYPLPPGQCLRLTPFPQPMGCGGCTTIVGS
eukprot:2040060-Rhodomonas_salina.1